MKTKNNSSEYMEQTGFVNWFRNKFQGVLIFHIPNGEHRNISVGKRLKDEGVVAGIPDLFIPAWKVWIEMKTKDGGTLSFEQKRIHKYLESVGYTVIIGNGATDASSKVLEFRKDITIQRQPRRLD